MADPKKVLPPSRSSKSELTRPGLLDPIMTPMGVMATVVASMKELNEVGHFEPEDQQDPGDSMAQVWNKYMLQRETDKAVGKGAALEY